MKENISKTKTKYYVEYFYKNYTIRFYMNSKKNVTMILFANIKTSDYYDEMDAYN